MGLGVASYSKLNFLVTCHLLELIATVALSEKCTKLKKMTCEPDLFCVFLKTIVLESMPQFHSYPYTAALTIVVSYTVQKSLLTG